MENKDMSVIFEALKVVSEHQREQNKLIKKMFFGLLIAVSVIFLSISGTVLYIWYNSDIVIEETTSYQQDTGEKGDIINGHQFKDNTIENIGVDSSGKTEGN